MQVHYSRSVLGIDVGVVQDARSEVLAALFSEGPGSSSKDALNKMSKSLCSSSLRRGSLAAELSLPRMEAGMVLSDD